MFFYGHVKKCMYLHKVFIYFNINVNIFLKTTHNQNVKYPTTTQDKIGIYLIYRHCRLVDIIYPPCYW